MLHGLRNQQSKYKLMNDSSMMSGHNDEHLPTHDSLYQPIEDHSLHEQVKSSIELSKNKNIKDLHHRISTIDVSQSLIISPRDLKKHEERDKKKLKEAYRILDEAELLVSQKNSSLEASVNQILSFKDSLRKVVGRKKQF